ncbi:MAG: ParA family protein [Chitinispirillaceae bacterium]
MKIISILNHKGGVGKTTFTASTAQALALTGHKVLAIDNDSQHNLSSLLNVGVKHPNISDVYQADSQEAPEAFLRSVMKTELPGLHIITSSRELLDSTVADIFHLRDCLQACQLERFYDYILIDNAPGMDRLQAAAINASDEIFVPTELRQFAVDGLVEMNEVLKSRYPQAARITRIIPNFYRNVKRQNTFIAALNSLFPGKVTSACIPMDSVFDEVVTEGKILFLHRLYSKGAAIYIKLVHELFSFEEKELRVSIIKKRKEHIRDEARQRYYERQAEVKK